MKKLFTFISAMVIAASMQSCEGPAGPEGPMGPMGPAGQDGSSFFFINKEFTVESAHWINEGSYFSYTFDIPELNKEMCESASIVVYRYYDETQTPLPDVKHHSEDKEEKNENGEIVPFSIYWTTTVDYDYQPGKITFYYTCSDFFTNENPPTMDFRLVVHY